MKDVNKMTKEDLKRIEEAHGQKSNPTQEEIDFLERAKKAVAQNK
ncbi:hypothetical protein IMCC3317_43300 [Kordia antarctica]|uniref:Uncharacterized protein n=1 Tax=Kordia antarctica TaxID=1218801 RepID=A0A7L4ZR26_9FLAO|nr:hypothetical protein [Kordia antarctica]QHI38930.1 hypothetical protein IMCC3317_43300 [Kordia antarctica]